MLGLDSTTAMSSMRPPITAGPSSRNSSFFMASSALDCAAAVRVKAAIVDRMQNNASRFVCKRLGNMDTPPDAARNHTPLERTGAAFVSDVLSGAARSEGLFRWRGYGATKSACYAIQLFLKPHG